MYVKIRKIGCVNKSEDLTITISKTASVKELKCQIESKWNCSSKLQKLFYKGKVLADEYRIVDYDIRLNDVIQLLMQSEQKQNVADEESEGNISDTVQSPEPVAGTSKNGASNSEELAKVDENSSIACEESASVENNYYREGDLVDVKDVHYGAWFEAQIVKITCSKKQDTDLENSENLTFHVKFQPSEEGAELHKIAFKNLRPRAFHILDLKELSENQVVLVNYNVDEPQHRGYWYDMRIDSLDVKGRKKNVTGTVFVGADMVPLENSKIKFLSEIMRIEKPALLTERDDYPLDIKLRKQPYNCNYCRDAERAKCKHCGCAVCAGKHDEHKILMCDDCNSGYHLGCLNPPLEVVPESPEWYCPECKNDENEIVKEGDKLKASKKRSKMPSNINNGSRDWGRGMACVGRTKECTIVPRNHYGPVPGVDVGMRWLYRMQASEAGIHRPPVSGIHGRETDGAYSIVLSGGYEDDVDGGQEFWYTGAGGRDLSGNKRVAGQSCDQTLTLTNKALALNCKAKFDNVNGADAGDKWREGKPVRVIRSSKLKKHSPYAPSKGFRYDGIYKVVKYLPLKGKSGYIVWRYLLRRDDPVPAPWEENGYESELIYTAGYLEAKKQEKIESKTEKKKKKRKALEEINDEETESVPKKAKNKYKLDKNVADLIKTDEINMKLWNECKKYLAQGKQTYLDKVQEEFMCICCQDLVYKPITTDCGHNICHNCLKRSFACAIYTCPYCRTELGSNYNMPINENLSQILLLLFPGYEVGR